MKENTNYVQIKSNKKKMNMLREVHTPVIVSGNGVPRRSVIKSN